MCGLGYGAGGWGEAWTWWATAHDKLVPWGVAGCAHVAPPILVFSPGPPPARRACAGGHGLLGGAVADGLAGVITSLAQQVAAVCRMGGVAVPMDRWRGGAAATSGGGSRVDRQRARVGRLAPGCCRQRPHAGLHGVWVPQSLLSWAGA